MFAQGILESHLELTSNMCLYSKFTYMPLSYPKFTNQYPLINPSFVAASGVNRHVKSAFHWLDIEMGSFAEKQ